MQCRSIGLMGLLALGVVAGAGTASAATNLVTNGDFESESLTGANQIASAPYGFSGTTVTGWTSSGNGYLYTPAPGTTSGTTADNGGAKQGQAGANNIQLWGPGDGSNNGLTLSPTGGNFVGFDGAFDPGAITQTINNLTVGTNYSLTFNWATAQYQNASGPTTDGWTVGFGNQTFATPTLNTASQGFDPWRLQTFTFQATSTSQVLSFLATGAPAGAPPFSLLDSVSLVAAPEPATWALALVGLLGLGAFRVFGTRSNKTAAAA